MTGEALATPENMDEPRMHELLFPAKYREQRLSSDLQHRRFPPMSTAINVYAVCVEKLQRLIGSGDILEAAVICKEEAYKLDYDPRDEDVTITCADALVELVNGETTHPYHGFLYGYAFEAMCSSLGKELSNICPISSRGSSEWFDDVERALTEKGIPLSFYALTGRGSPVPIPRPDDFPAIGIWTAEEIAHAAPIVRAADTSGLDADMAETLEQIGGWVLDTAALPGHSLIGFHQ